MRNKYITFICLIFILCLCCSCNNKENIRINTVDKKKQDVISEDITIDKAYLNKRYPNKTVLTWVYHEKEYMSDKERELYKHPLGMRYLTNRQIISLNDNLNKQGKSYVVCFKKLNGGKKFAKEIKEMIAKGESVDFISSENYEGKDNKTFLVPFNLIYNGLLENLLTHKKELGDYFNTLPEKGIELSLINGKFYGYNISISSQNIMKNWYVNTELAKKYNIKISKKSKDNYKKWYDNCKKVYEGEKRKKSENFLTLTSLDEPIKESHIIGTYGKGKGQSNVNIKAFAVGNSGKVENYYKFKDVKNEYYNLYKYNRAGFFNVLNKTKNRKKANIFIDNETYDTVGDKDEVDWEQYPQVHKMKKIQWGTPMVEQEDLMFFCSINSVCSRSKNKKIALEAYDFINSNAEASNIILYPEYDGTGKKYSITENEYYDFYSREENYSNFEARSQKMINPFVTNSFADRKTIEEYKENINLLKYNKNYIGKYYDFKPVKKEVKNILEIEKKYTDMEKGILFSEKEEFEQLWEKFLNELDNAGMDKVLEYLNRK
ncbi:hypothetical protein [uncultured Eubacterium sp.]|uniref:hypothetical protein n=1 Tax=uncultured Eubacterium sp. TaxID=165185 RepID=UPI002806177F|nr:hypothetical protein [uncultured Eubacterium sp.]